MTDIDGDGRTTTGLGQDGRKATAFGAGELPMSPDERIGRREPMERNERRAIAVERPRGPLPMPRQAKQKRMWGRVVLGIWFALAMLGTIYFALIAGDRYLVEAHFTVQAINAPVGGGSIASSASGGSDPISSPLGLTGGSASAFSDSFMVSEYLQSPAAVDDIGKMVDLRKMFTSEDADFVERLGSDATPERLWRYWSHRVNIDYDPMTATVVMQVDAFTGPDAYALARAALKAADTLINRSSEEGRRDAVKIAEDQLHRSEDVLSKATRELNDFQGKMSTIDPAGDVQVEETVITTIMGEVADARSQLGAMSTLGTANGPARAAMIARIAALEQQVQAEKDKLTKATTSAGSPAVAGLLSEIQHLQVERDFAKADYGAALQGYEATLSAASATQRFLVTYVEPVLPTQPRRPQRWRMIAITWIVTAVGTGIAALIYSTIREQLL